MTVLQWLFKLWCGLKRARISNQLRHFVSRQVMTIDPDTQLVSVYVNRSKGDPANSCRLFRVLTGRECTFDIDSMVSRWDGPRAACKVDIFVSVSL